MLITLTTDFGNREGYPAAMKGVIYTIAPEAKIVDITHEIQPQNLYEAAFILEINVFFFPPGTVHIVVVDPGVGTERRPLVGRIGDQYLVAPDNGVITRLLLRSGREGWPTAFMHADQPEYWRSGISATFHGRDIFAPLGAHLAAGVPLEALGSLIQDPIRLPLQIPERTPDGVCGEIIHIDHFGNAISNLRAGDLPRGENLQVILCGQAIHGLSRTFSDHASGELLALWDSSGYLMVSEFGGLKQIQPQVGEPICVRA